MLPRPAWIQRSSNRKGWVVFFKGGTPLINLEHKAELLNENKMSNKLRESISGTRSRLPVGQAGLEVESQDCQMRDVDLLQCTTCCMSAVFIQPPGQLPHNTNVPPTPLLSSTPIHNSLTRRSGPTPSLWNWNPTKTFCCCQATATPSPHSTSSTVASCSEGNFLLLRLGTKRNLKESQRRINKKRKKKPSFSSEPAALLLAAEAGRLPDRDSLVCMRGSDCLNVTPITDPTTFSRRMTA